MLIICLELNWFELLTFVPLNLFCFEYFIHNKVPIREHLLRSKGCNILYLMSLLWGANETFNHFFSTVPFLMTFEVGNRLQLVVVLILIIFTTLTFLHIDLNDELQIVLLVVVINIFWFSRNQPRFHNKIIFLQFIHE